MTAASVHDSALNPQRGLQGDLFLISNELGQKKLQAQFEEAAAAQNCPLKKAASGVSGFCLLDLASLDPAIARVDFYDISERVTTFWKAFNSLIKEVPNRLTALEKVKQLIEKRQADFFSKPAMVETTLNRLDLSVRKGLSFLSTDERYARIRKLFVDKCISIQNKNLFAQGSMTNFWKTLRDKGYSPSLVYWSNVFCEVEDGTQLANFKANLAEIPHGAIYMDASRMDGVQPGALLASYASLRLSIAPNFPPQLPDHLFCLDVVKKDDAHSLVELARQKMPMDWYLPETDTSLFSIAVAYGSKKCVSFLLSYCPDVAKRVSPEKRYTPLHTVAEDSELVVMLRHADVDINARDEKGRTAAFYMASHNKPRALTTLLNLGAWATIPDSEKCTPLMEAARKGNALCVIALLGARNIDLDDVKVAFHYASGEALKVMLQHKAYKNLKWHVNTQSERGGTLLYVAAYRGKEEDVAWLLSQGADPTLTDSAGLTPLAMAEQQRHAAVVKLLKTKGE